MIRRPRSIRRPALSLQKRLQTTTSRLLVGPIAVSFGILALDPTRLTLQRLSVVDQLNVYIDKDPSGSKLLATTKPLVEALRFVQPLQHSRPGHAEVWSMSFEIYLRQGEDLAIETLAPLRNGS